MCINCHILIVYFFVLDFKVQLLSFFVTFIKVHIMGMNICMFEGMIELTIYINTSISIYDIIR